MEASLATKGAELQILVDTFVQHVQSYTEALWRAESRTANKHHDKIVAAFKKLRAHGDVGRDALAVLFTHPRMDVRTAAATFLLRHRTDEAKVVLMEAASGKGMVPFMASEALKRWEEGGEWTLDPATDADQVKH